MRHTDIVERWAGHVEADGSAVAVVTPDQVWTRRRLAGLVTGLRLELERADPSAAPVLVACSDPVPVIAALLAAAATGRTVAPLDVRLPASRWSAVTADLRPGVIVADRAGLEAMAASGTTEPGGPAVVRSADVPDAPWRLSDWQGLTGPDAGYVFFTSGTTGRPKGVRGSLAAVGHFLEWETGQFGIRAGSRVSMLTSPGFDAFLRDALVPLVAGGSVHAARLDEIPVGAALAEWLEHQQVDVLHCVPTVFRTLRGAGLTPASLPHLRTVLLAGEPVRAGDVAWWRSLFGDDKTLVNLYGPSETTMTKVFRVLTADDALAAVVPAGRPLPGVEVLVRAGGRPVTGTIGEVELRTPFPLGGYLTGPAGGFEGPDVYRTGDLGRIRADGELEILGRRDQQVKIHGVRVELGEVEEVLRSHPSVVDVCATVVTSGADDALLCAYVVTDGSPGSPTSPDDEELRSYAARQLSPGHRPALYVRLAALPRTLTGKIDRRSLPAPSEARAAAGGPAPRDPVEHEIARLFGELLHLPAVGRDQDFTLLGGDSLAVARLLDSLRSRFGAEIALRTFVTDPTVAGLARAVAATERVAAEPLPGGER